MFRGFFALLLLILALAGFCAFSLFAHDRVDQSQASKLSEQLESLQQQHDQIQNAYQAQGKRFARDKRNWEDTLYVMFPGEENRQRISTLFHGDIQEEAEAEETPIGDDGPEPTDENSEEATEVTSEGN